MVDSPDEPATFVELALTPCHELGETGRAAEFESLGDDPWFLALDVDKLATVAPGWWRLRWELPVIDGWIVTPAAYPDFGAGFKEADALRLREPDAQGVSETICWLPAPLKRLRLDPTPRRARFRAGPLQLERLTPAQAAEAMRAGVHTGTYPPTSPESVVPPPLLPRGAWLDRLRLRLRMRRGSGAVAAQFEYPSLPGPPPPPAPPGTELDDLVTPYVMADLLYNTSYDLWYRKFDPLLEEIRARAAMLPADARVLIVWQVKSTNPAMFEDVLAGITGQACGNWELRIGLSHRVHAHAWAAAEREAAADVRVRVFQNESSQLRRLLEGEVPDLCLVLSEQSVLAPNAVCEFLHAFAVEPDAQVLYSDSDTWRGHRWRKQPRMKPDWSPVLFASHDYIGGTWVVRTKCLLEVLARSRDASGALAACVEGLDSSQVIHVPKVLHHDVPGTAPSGPRLQARAPTRGPLVSVVVPTRDRLTLLRTCVEGVLRDTRYEQLELIIVDNGSEEAQTLAYLRQLEMRPRCRVLRDPSPFNFSALVNLGVRAARGDFVCLLNNDIEVIRRDWLAQMVLQARAPDVAAVGAMLYYPDDTVQHGGVMLGVGGVAGHMHHRIARGDPGYMQRAFHPQELSAVTGACMLVRRSAFDAVGGFDEDLPVAFNDIDFCIRLRLAGWRIVWTPDAELYHHESVSRGKEDTPEKHQRFLDEVARMAKRWDGVLQTDPAYNPNLTLDGADFGLSFPPRVDPTETYRTPCAWRRTLVAESCLVREGTLHAQATSNLDNCSQRKMGERNT
jgi:GT2 family glycosyltransferase